jgi:hypothetical protein
MATPAEVVTPLFDFKLVIPKETIGMRHLDSVTIHAQLFPVTLIAAFNVLLGRLRVEV